MCAITLVRHGQASYLENNYDQLSPLGELQARKLGEYWARHGIVFDHFFHGPARRHIHTYELVAGDYRQAGISLPEPVVLEEFDEFQGEQIYHVLTPLLSERHSRIRSLSDAVQAAGEKAERWMAIERLFHEVALHWVDGEVVSPEVESWKQFTSRVSRGVDRVLACCRDSSSAVVFTSGGPTAVAAAIALELSPRQTLDMAFRPRNASYSEFLVTGDSLSLSTFNNFPHLDDPSLLTYR